MRFARRTGRNTNAGSAHRTAVDLLYSLATRVRLPCKPTAVQVRKSRANESLGVLVKWPNGGITCCHIERCDNLRTVGTVPLAKFRAKAARRGLLRCASVNEDEV